MELLIGFVLGFVASTLSAVLLNCIPAYRQRPLFSILSNPRLQLQLRLDTEQRQIKGVIDSVFRAWEEKSPERYRDCWTDDAVRIVGATSEFLHLPEIMKLFERSIGRYRNIRVLLHVMEEIKLAQPPGDQEASIPLQAHAKVHYRLQLSGDFDLPDHEEATEYYVLRKSQDEGWKIMANLDHAQDVILSAGDRPEPASPKPQAPSSRSRRPWLEAPDPSPAARARKAQPDAVPPPV